MVVVVWFAKMRFPLFSCLPLVSCCLKMLNWFYIALKFLLYIYISYEGNGMPNEAFKLSEKYKFFNKPHRTG